MVTQVSNTNPDPHLEDDELSGVEQPAMLDITDAVKEVTNQVDVEVETPSAPTTPGAATAEMLAAMSKQIEALTGEVKRLQNAPKEGDGETPGGWPWQYYKMPDSDPLRPGWIFAAPGGASPSTGHRAVGAYNHQIQKGNKPVTEYGVAPIPSTVRRVSGRMLRPFLDNGGAKELPVTQVLAYKWHVKPPIPGLQFPQVDAVKDEIRHFICRDCEYDMWCLVDNDEAAAEAFRHLRQNKNDGRHNYPREEANALLESQGFKGYAPFALEAKEKELQSLKNLAPSRDAEPTLTN